MRRIGSLLVRRVAVAGAVVLAASLLVFAVVQALPGDPARQRLAATATPAEVQVERTRLGLDAPVAERYVDWLGGAVRGDLGTSWGSDRPVRQQLLEAAGTSAWLVLAVLLVTVPLAIGVALMAGLRPGGPVDRAVVAGSALGLAVPPFVLAIGALLLLSTGLGWVPAVSVPELDRPIPLQPGILVVPVSVLAVGLIAYVVPLLRAQVVTVAASPAVAAARLRGVRGRALVWRHVLPGVVPLGGQLLAVGTIALATETIVVEAVCGYPGLGLLLRTAVGGKDLPTVQGIALLLSLVVVLALALGDGAGRRMTSSRASVLR